MKQSSNNKNRSNGRYGHFNNTRRSNAVNRNTVYDSTGPCGRIRGTAQQLIDKYLSAAKDAKGQNDRVLSEVCTQHADHYARQLQLALQNERPAQPTTEIPIPETEQIPTSETLSEQEPTETEQISDLPFMGVEIPMPVPELPQEQVEPKTETKTPRRGRKTKTSLDAVS